MPIVEFGFTSSSLIKDLIGKIKADSDFWNEDPEQRAKDSYLGFQSIRNNRVASDVVSSDFPILFVDADGIDTMPSNTSTIHTGSIVILQVTCLFVEGDENVQSSRDRLEILLMSVIDTFGLGTVEKILFFEDVFLNYRTHNLATKVLLNG